MLVPLAKGVPALGGGGGGGGGVCVWARGLVLYEVIRELGVATTLATTTTTKKKEPMAWLRRSWETSVGIPVQMRAQD